MPRPPTHYEVLGFARDASSVDVAHAFREKLATLKAQPDGGSVEEVDAAREAYQVLATPCCAPATTPNFRPTSRAGHRARVRPMSRPGESDAGRAARVRVDQVHHPILVLSRSRWSTRCASLGRRTFRRKSSRSREPWCRKPRRRTTRRLPRRRRPRHPRRKRARPPRPAARPPDGRGDFRQRLAQHRAHRGVGCVREDVRARQRRGDRQRHRHHQLPRGRRRLADFRQGGRQGPARHPGRRGQAIRPVQPAGRWPDRALP